MDNDTPMKDIELRFREGPSDKVYRVALEASGLGYVVNFAYGRRGSTLNTGTKTQCPLPYAKALAVYDKLVKSKTAKGYKPHGGHSPETGTGMQIVASAERRDTGLRAQLLNPIAEDEVEHYLASNRWCAQEKYDGRRMLLKRTIDSDTLIPTNRDGLTVGCPQALAERMVEVIGRFVIDGECVGERFFAFDLLESVDGDLRSLPYAQRLTELSLRFGGLGGSVQIAETAFTPEAKRRLLTRLKVDNREGIVFKDLHTPWYAGRPASGGQAIKCKFWATCSCVVARQNGRRSVELTLSGQSVGNVTIPPNRDIPPVGQVVEVRYLYVNAPGGALYQPIYLGVRDDVSASDCTFDRQCLKYKAAA